MNMPETFRSSRITFLLKLIDVQRQTINNNMESIVVPELKEYYRGYVAALDSVQKMIEEEFQKKNFSTR